MKLYKNMQSILLIAIETLYNQTNMNLLAFHADTTKTNENTNSLKFNVKKLIF